MIRSQNPVYEEGRQEDQKVDTWRENKEKYTEYRV